MSEKPLTERGLWAGWRSGVFGEAGPRFAMHHMIADLVARSLGTSTGPDHDVRWQGRLVSVAEWVPTFDTPEPTNEDVLDRVYLAATQATAAIREGTAR